MHVRKKLSKRARLVLRVICGMSLFCFAIHGSVYVLIGTRGVLVSVGAALAVSLLSGIVTGLGFAAMLYALPPDDEDE